MSLLLVAILVTGCLSDKQGGSAFSCESMVSKIRSLIPTIVIKVPGSAPGQTPSKPLPATQEISTDWWKDQPDLKQEETAIYGQIGGLSSALAAKNVEVALNCFAPGEKDKYRQVLSQSPEMMPRMANDLKNARLSFLSPPSDQYGRAAEYAVTVDGQTLYIKFIKVDGKWVLQSF